MPEYRRAFVPGGTFFLTIVTFERLPLFSDRTHIRMLRAAVRRVKRERPFAMNAYAILPDHLHFVWTLPEGDSDFSRRIGRMKALFTKTLRAVQNGGQCPPYGLTIGVARVMVGCREYLSSIVWQVGQVNEL